MTEPATLCNVVTTPGGGAMPVCRSPGSWDVFAVVAPFPGIAMHVEKTEVVGAKRPRGVQPTLRS